MADRDLHMTAAVPMPMADAAGSATRTARVDTALPQGRVDLAPGTIAGFRGRVVVPQSAAVAEAGPIAGTRVALSPQRLQVDAEGAQGGLTAHIDASPPQIQTDADGVQGALAADMRAASSQVQADLRPGAIGGVVARVAAPQPQVDVRPGAIVGVEMQSAPKRPQLDIDATQGALNAHLDVRAPKTLPDLTLHNLLVGELAGTMPRPTFSVLSGPRIATLDATIVDVLVLNAKIVD